MPLKTHRLEVQRVIRELNALIKTDEQTRKAVELMVNTRYPVSAEAAQIPELQVMVKDGQYSIGLVAILNYLCGTLDHGNRAGSGPIAAVLTDTSGLVRFAHFETWDQSSKE